MLKLARGTHKWSVKHLTIMTYVPFRCIPTGAATVLSGTIVDS